jgi:hypothetical protein
MECRGGERFALNKYYGLGTSSGLVDNHFPSSFFQKHEFCKIYPSSRGDAQDCGRIQYASVFFRGDWTWNGV